MKQILDTLTAGQSRIQEHFHFLHQNPGLAFEETVAANYIAGKLREWGYEETEGLGQTGAVPYTVSPTPETRRQFIALEGISAPSGS